jgi:hypothetical protein
MDADELEVIREEENVASSKYCLGLCLEVLKMTTRSLSKSGWCSV